MESCTSTSGDENESDESSRENVHYLVVYEDGDEEEYTIDELKKIIVVTENNEHNDEKTKKSKSRSTRKTKGGEGGKKNRTETRTVVKKKTKEEEIIDGEMEDTDMDGDSSSNAIDDDDDDDDDDDQDGDYNYQEEEEDDDDEGEFEEEDDEDFEISTPIRRKFSATTTTSPATKSNSSPRMKKKSTMCVTPSPNKSTRRKKSSSSVSSTAASSVTDGGRSNSRLSTSSSSRANNNTIAVHGLPRGALGRCVKTGFTIRTLESIRPVLNRQKKKRGYGDGHGGESGSCGGHASDPLPCRIMVISRDRNGIIVPNNFVGKTFASGSDLHAALSEVVVGTINGDGSINDRYELATYEMEPLADPSFSSWEFTQARLISAGLIKTNNEDDDNDDSNTEINKGPFVVQISWDGEANITGTVTWYDDIPDGSNDDNDGIQWAIIESNDHGKQIPPVLVGAPRDLIEHRQLNIENLEEVDTGIDLDEGISNGSSTKDDASIVDDSNEDKVGSAGSGNDLLPPPSKFVSQVRIPASLLQKSIRRGNGLCTPSPLLQACASLLLPEKARPGSTLAMLKAVWGGMIVDASPFEDSSDCLGLPALLLLSLVAKADPEWTMPPPLRRAAVIAALRTATSAPSQQWIGHVRQSDNWWHLESVDSEPSDGNDERATSLRNILRTAQAVVGGRLAWGKWSRFIGDQSAAAVIAYLNDEDWKGSYLPNPPSPHPTEMALIKGWEEGKQPPIPKEPRLQHLDQECCLSSIEPMVMPSTLVLLQAALSYPPTQWKKHGLPSLSKQIRKLISEANPRYRQRVQLARLATWGTKETESLSEPEQLERLSESYDSYREVVTHTGNLSEKEIEVVDVFEAIQNWQLDRLQIRHASNNTTPEKPNQVADCAIKQENSFVQSRRVKAGPPPTAFDGRVAFLLAFASAIEVEVYPDPDSTSSREVVSAMFCGDPDEPLLVQRIGKARKEGQELATGGGSSSGATAVPSLGYVQRSRSAEEARLMEAAEVAVAAYWKRGRTLALPIPPPGFQWELNGPDLSDDSGWEKLENAVVRTAEFVDTGDGEKTWRFTIGGVAVDPFDARSVISPCALGPDDDSHQPVPLETGSPRERSLRIALYLPEDPTNSEDQATPLPYGAPVLDSMTRLHELAAEDRNASEYGPSEGIVYDWIPLANSSPLPSRTWRDTLLAIRTRDRDHVVLGQGVRSDGTGAARDMTEGVLLRLFHALEMLYPTALRKEGAFKFRVRPRGAAYHHMLLALERLGRGDCKPKPSTPSPIIACVTVGRKASRGSKRNKAEANEDDYSPSWKRPRRVAAVTSAKRTTVQLKSEDAGARSSVRKCSKRARSDNEDQEGYEDAEVDEESEDDLTVEDVKMDEIAELPAREQEYLPLPTVTTTLWAHQEASVSKVVQGVREGKRGHADASAVGAGKTLTALATITRLAQWIEATGRTRHGVLVMLPTKALIKEWLLEVATHTHGFHVIEQREDGTLFSLTYSKTHPPIDGNSLIITTLDRVCRHPFIRQTAWDFVVIDECLSVQNASAKRNPSAWRQIEVSMCGVLMLSATFFRSKYDSYVFLSQVARKVNSE